MRSRLIGVSILGTLLLGCGAALNQPPNPNGFKKGLNSNWFAGAAKNSITPDHQVYLGGFSRVRRSSGVHDSLFVKALILRDGQGSEVVIVTLDAVGFLRHDVMIVRDSLAARGIEPGRVFIVSTHLHSGPDFIGLFGEPRKGISGRDEAYIRDVIQTIIETIESARKKIRPVDLFTGRADGAGLCQNHRLPKIIDNEITTLFVVPRGSLPGSGDAVATLTNFGCHPEVLDGANTLITADFPGYFYRGIEKKLGGVSLFANGILGGMVSPVMTRGRNFAGAEELGNAIARRVIENTPQARRLRGGMIEASGREITVFMENKGFVQAARAGLMPTSTIRGDSITTEVNLLRIGELEIITVPGEIIPPLGLAIKARICRPRMLWGLANDEVGYILSREDYVNPRYAHERDYGLGSSIGEKVLGATKDLLHRFSGASNCLQRIRKINRQ